MNCVTLINSFSSRRKRNIQSVKRYETQITKINKESYNKYKW